MDVARKDFGLATRRKPIVLGFERQSPWVDLEVKGYVSAQAQTPDNRVPR
jgi:hypothetical protein